MARIRSIKPEILEDEKTAGLSDGAYRLFTSVIFLADDHGNLRADDRWLTAQIWWASKNPPRVAELLRELVTSQLVTVYEVRGQQYMAIRSWLKHQRIDNAGKPRVPGPSEGSPKFAEIRGEIPLELTAGWEGDKEEEKEIAAGAADQLVTPSKPKAAKRATQLPEGWRPAESAPNAKATAAAKARGIDIAAALDRMTNWAIAKGATGKDWDARWRLWLSNEKAPWGASAKVVPSTIGPSGRHVFADFGDDGPSPYDMLDDDVAS